MDKLKRHKMKMVTILLICLVTAAEGILGAHFFHGEMTRQIDENLETQALQMIQGYEMYDQNREILIAGIQADALEINRIHGEFIYNALAQAHRDKINGILEDALIESQVREVLKNSEEAFHLESVFIQNASAHRNSLDKLIRDTVQKPGYSLKYLAKGPSELYHSGTLDIVMEDDDALPWNIYAKAVYYEPLDMIVLFQGSPVYEEDTVTRLVRHIQNINERTVAMAGSMEDVIIVQENGYSLYSGKFEANSSRRVNRMAYNDLGPKDEFPANIVGFDKTYRTLMVKSPEGHVQERYAYILYDDRHKNYVIVSRLTSDIRDQEEPLIFLSRLVAFANILVVSFIACLLIARTEALEEEGLNP